MEHRELRKTFGDDFSKSAFREVDDELRLVGKYGELTMNDDGSFDVWVVMPDRSPMNSRRLNTICGKLENLDKEALLRKLDGEAYWITAEKSKAVEGGFLAGIKKKRSMNLTEEQLETLRKRMRVIHRTSLG